MAGIGSATLAEAALVLTELFGTKLELATSSVVFSCITILVVIAPTGLASTPQKGPDWLSRRQPRWEAAK